MKSNLLTLGSSCAACLAVAGAAPGATPTVILSQAANAGTTDEVAGAPGFIYGGTQTFSVSFGFPTRSPDGVNWAIGALVRDTGNGNALQNAVITGTGPSGSAKVYSPASYSLSDPFVPETRSVTALTNQTTAAQIFASVNDAGRYAYNFRTTEGTGSRYVAKFDGTTQTVVAREGTASAVSGASYGTAFGDVTIFNNGNVAYRAGLTPAASNPSLFRTTGTTTSSTVAVRAVDSPTVPAGLGSTATYTSFTDGSFGHNAAGTSYSVTSKLSGDLNFDEVFVVDGGVKVREGFAVPGSGDARLVKTGGNDLRGSMSPNGSWFARGRFADNDSFLVRDGTILAKSGTAVSAMTGGLANEVIPGSVPGTFGPNINNRFAAAAGDLLGNFAYFATTTLTPGVTNAVLDTVLVYNNTDVLARVGTQVDLDQNPLTSDAAYINSIANDRLFLGEDGFAYFVASLRNGPTSGTSLGEAFIRVAVPVPEPTAVGLLAVAGAMALRRRAR